MGSLLEDLVLGYKLSEVCACEWEWGTSYLFNIGGLKWEFMAFCGFKGRSITIKSIGIIVTYLVLFPRFSNLVLSLLMVETWEDVVSEKVMVGTGLEGVIIFIYDRDLSLPVVGIEAYVD